MPAKTLNISLPEGLRDLVVREVAEGGYGSVSEYVREAVREALRRRRTEVLERKLLEGLASPGIEMDAAAWRRLRRDMGGKARGRAR